MRILVTGATGYIGSRLVPRLLAEGHQINVLVRDPNQLKYVDWNLNVTVSIGDVRDKKTLYTALESADIAYYLIHSMRSSSKVFHQHDMDAAESFGEVAASMSTRIIFLGALGNPHSLLTSHLLSRHATGEALAKYHATVTELRAGPVIGAGSLPFEMIRYLTERIPVMICPKWVFTRVQPIGIRDTLEYLISALNLQHNEHQVIEIGGSTVLSYGDMMTEYAKARGLRRAMIRVPVLTQRLSSYWVHWVTPLKASFARPLVEGLKSEVIVSNLFAHDIFPNIQPLEYRDAVHEALMDLHPHYFQDAPIDQSSMAKSVLRGMIIETRKVETNLKSGQIFDAFCSLGGDNGWYMNWGWRLRAFVDKLFGGIGLRKGRPSNLLSIGDAVDFWRVQKLVPNSRLLLHAEMKVPGKAWLEFKIEQNKDALIFVQKSYFAPKGLIGLAYWYALLPIHRVVFDGLAKRVIKMAENSPKCN